MDLRDTYDRVEKARKLIDEARTLAGAFADKEITGGHDEVLREADLVTDKLEEAQQILLETEAVGLPDAEESEESEETPAEETPPAPDEQVAAEETFDFMLEKQELEHRSRLIESHVYRAAADKVGDPITVPGASNESQDELLNSAAVALEAALGSHPEPQTLIELAELRVLQLEIKRARHVCELTIEAAGEESPYAMKAQEILERIDSDPSLKDRGKCFIATAACGTPAHPDVATLRRFRDATLERSSLGRALVRSYYALSPPLAIAIERRPAARRIVRSLVVAPAAATVRRLHLA